MIADCTTVAPTTTRTRWPLALRLACRKAWVEGHGTLAEVAQKHNVPPSTLESWYKRENWKRSRDNWLAKQRNDEDAQKLPEVSPANPENFDRNARAREYDQLLQKLKAQLADENDPQKIDRLASAIAKLEEPFMVFAGIPKPGSLRPKEPSRKRSPQSFDPIDPPAQSPY